MDYMITFSDVMATVITLGLGVIGFFMKRWISVDRLQLTGQIF